MNIIELPGGVYICRLDTGEDVLTRALTIVK